MASGLAAIGLLFLARPRLGAKVFGLPTEGIEARPFVRALAFRDLALAGALGLLARRPAALGPLAASLAAIPMADAGLVAHLRGRRALASIALHLVSATALIGLAAAARRSA